MLALGNAALYASHSHTPSLVVKSQVFTGDGGVTCDLMSSVRMQMPGGGVSNPPPMLLSTSQLRPCTRTASSIGEARKYFFMTIPFLYWANRFPERIA